MKKHLLVLVAGLALASCGRLEQAKNSGGETTVKIESGQKVVNASWKDNSLWVLTEKADTSFKPRMLKYVQFNDYDRQGIVYIEETK